MKKLQITGLVSLLCLVCASSALSDERMAAMMKDHIMMKDGKMMMMKDGKSMMMDKDMMMENGSKVMMDGTVMTKDGGKMMMKDGQMMGMDGMMMMDHVMMKDGKMIAGRQILCLVDQHFRTSEMDGGVYDA